MATTATGTTTARPSGFPINRRHQRMATVQRIAELLYLWELDTWGFQSIGVTKEWRQFAYEEIRKILIQRFPINRRHQRMATDGFPGRVDRLKALGFQSIGVTKEWRRWTTWLAVLFWRQEFPINRRHQRMATSGLQSASSALQFLFPINRRHQRMATQLGASRQQLPPSAFPINRRHQRMATVAAVCAIAVRHRFPINRRHQRMATIAKQADKFMKNAEFPINRRHQRMATVGSFAYAASNMGKFPINRRHQRMATRCIPSLSAVWRGFQSIGVTKEWRHQNHHHRGRFFRSPVSNQ